ncbi:MAG TPA: fatty acid desaturase [Vicinamibacterales bacterium]|nr:fatty acid desaturase [Vicinamibacterales bacterium]
MPRTDYIWVTRVHQHVTRSRQILAAHPEVRDLGGPTPSSAAWVVSLVVAQFALALLLSRQPWWIWLPVAYLVGATIDHALWVLIHECTHSLVFRGATANKLTALVANLPLVFPAALSFQKYHLLHHSHLGELDFDADVPGPVESHVVRTAPLKAVWLAAFAAVQGLVRTHRLKKVRFFDAWIVANLVFQISFVATLWALVGIAPLIYLLASSLAAIGLHPLGARWIQEHFVFAEGQETYSYYGPLNRVCFNMGYHNEHHDFVTVPWSRLPKLKALAPEFYDPLYAHRSWTALLVRFVLDRNCTLYDRVVRPSRASHLG